MRTTYIDKGMNNLNEKLKVNFEKQLKTSIAIKITGAFDHYDFNNPYQVGGKSSTDNKFQQIFLFLEYHYDIMAAVNNCQ